MENNTEEKFNEGATNLGLPVHPAFNLQATTNKVDNLKSSRSIVRWAFQAKQGQISDVFECGDCFVVAALTEVNEDEFRPFAQVQNELRFEALNNAKFDYVAKQLEGAKTLEEAAQKLGDVEIQKAEGVTFGSYRFGMVGAEPAVIGTAMVTEAGQTSEPIKGYQGVYVVRPGEKKVADGNFDEAAEVTQLNSRYSYSLPYQALGMLEKKADIEDNRFNFQ